MGKTTDVKKLSKANIIFPNNISRIVFNSNQTLRNINLDDYRNASSSSDCQSSTFRYEPHGHVITWDLWIVRNRKLRRLLEKGPKYREQNNIDWHLNKEILTKAVDDYARNWSKREGCHVSALEEWLETVKLIISNRINSLQHGSFLPCNRILEDPHVTQDRTVNEIIQTHATTLEDVFDIKLQQLEGKKNLPRIYWIPKLHKTPYGARFIAGSSSCITTRLSKLITECLKLVRSHCTAYCKTIRERTGVNCMWPG